MRVFFGGGGCILLSIYLFILMGSISFYDWFDLVDLVGFLAYQPFSVI